MICKVLTMLTWSNLEIRIKRLSVTDFGASLMV